MKYVYSAIGGSGSTVLYKKLGERYKVANRPDTIFQQLFGGLVIERGTFEERTGGFARHGEESLETLLPRYVRYLEGQPERTVVFNTAGEHGLFSKCSVSNVVFLIRHPLHAYVSWAKPERHGGLLAGFGGVNSSVGVEWFGNRWKRMAADSLRWSKLGLNGGSVRYEYAASDAETLHDQAWIFHDWAMERRNPGVLSSAFEQQLRDIVEPEYTALYESWDL